MADPTLTDEELAGYEAALVPPRLVAAYRASRAEVERLAADRDSWKRMAEAARHRNEELVAARAALPHLP